MVEWRTFKRTEWLLWVFFGYDIYLAQKGSKFDTIFFWLQLNHKYFFTIMNI